MCVLVYVCVCRPHDRSNRNVTWSSSQNFFWLFTSWKSTLTHTHTSINTLWMHRNDYSFLLQCPRLPLQSCWIESSSPLSGFVRLKFLRDEQWRCSARSNKEGGIMSTQEVTTKGRKKIGGGGRRRTWLMYTSPNIHSKVTCLWPKELFSLDEGRRWESSTIKLWEMWVRREASKWVRDKIKQKRWRWRIKRG